jgi:hypothetical protein
MLAALLATAGLVAVAPTPAQAVGCRAHSICLHDPHQFGEPLWSWPAIDIVEDRCVNLTNFNNRVTSWRNTSNYRFVAFNSYNCSDVAGMFVLFPNSSSSNVGTSWNDKMSSIRYGV